MSSSDYTRPDINRLMTALRHGEPDRLPHLELWVTSKSVYEYVLDRKLDYDVEDARVGGISVAPEDYVEFAGRLGMDAVLCNFSWRPNNVFKEAADGSEHYVDGSVKTRADLDDLEPPVPLKDQLNYLERYLKSAEGTGIGVVANFTSFFDSAMLAIGVNDSFLLFYDAVEPESNDIFEVKKRWAGKMALIGNIPTVLLAYGSGEEIEETVKEYCVKLAPGGGYALGSSTSIMEGIPPENFVAMIDAAHKYGRYGSLGKDAGTTFTNTEGKSS